MGRPIIKLGEYYLEWSSIVDGPVSFGMTLEDFKEYYQTKYGTSGMDGLENRLARVEKCGTSYLEYLDAESVISGNRAGPDEVELTEEEIHRAYCLQEPIRGGWTPE